MYKKIVAIFAIIMCMALATIPAYAQVEEITEEEQSTNANALGETGEVSIANNAFTEEGNASLGDSLSSSDNKEFITVTTKKGNTFYLVIDRARDSENVYFLNKVDENDLQAFLSEGSLGVDSVVSTPSQTGSVGEISEDNGQKELEEKQKELELLEEERELEEKQQAENKQNYIIFGVAIIILVIAYITKSKKQKGQDDIDDYESEDEYEEEYDDDNDEDEVYGEDDFPDKEEDGNEEQEEEIEEDYDIWTEDDF